MKKHFTQKLTRYLCGCLLLSAWALPALEANAQTAPGKEWDYRFGGSSGDNGRIVMQTSDGGYIIGGYSLSGITGDKTQASQGSNDYWVVKINSSGTMQWDARFGGSGQDQLLSLQQTSDGGYILGGHSASGISGDKTQASQGSTDYWVVKINSSGVKQWDARFGGSDQDQLTSLQQTTDGGYILGGWSYSGISGDKSQANRGGGFAGADYWVVKITGLGVKQWDATFGGTAGDFSYSLQQTTDGGYILGGYSESGISGDKTTANLGGNDYWVVKINSLGVKQWDATLGGSSEDYLLSLQQATDGGYILGGYSTSGISGSKTQASRGGNDYWVVKTNNLGVKQWDATFGGSSDDFLFSLKQTTDGGYILGGNSTSGISGDKTQANQGGSDYWIVKISSLGAKQWDANFGGSGTDNLLSVQQTSDGFYVLGGNSSSGISGDKTQGTQGGLDYWVVKLGIPTVTNSISTSTITPSAFCQGKPVSIPFTATGTYTAGNVFTAQLSDANGTFPATPTAIGTLTGTTSGTINATFPAAAAAGSLYRIRVVSSTPSVTGTDNGSNLTIRALPTASISGTSTVCQNAASPSVTFTGASGTAPYTFTYQLNNGSTQTVTTTSGNTATVSVPTSAAGTFNYTLLSVQDANCSQSQTGTATVTVTSGATASISGTTSVCQNSGAPNVTFTGAGGTAPYTFTYKVNGGANQTATTSSGSSVTVAAPTGTSGSFVYTLVSVQDANCTQAQTGTATVTVNSLPTASISGTASVCQYTGPSTITFTGADGTAPYTFTYKVNSGANQTVTTTSGSTVTVAAPTTATGTFIYSLVSVQDANCSQSQSGSATVTVNPSAVVSASASPSTFMVGNTTTLSVTNPQGGVIYTWSGANLDSTSGPVVTATPATDGSFTYNVTADNGTCTSIASVTVTVQPFVTGSPLSGTYSVNKNQPTAARNFTNFRDFSQALFLNGISANVTVNVAAGTGPYTERLILASYTGATAGRRIVINGNGNTLSPTIQRPTFPEEGYGVVMIDGADNITLQNFNLTHLATSTRGWGVQLINDAQNIVIQNNVITVNATSTAPRDFMGIVASANYSQYNFAGNNVTNLSILNNQITGGYEGIRINGNASAYSTGIIITGNTITNPYKAGMFLQYLAAPTIGSATAASTALPGNNVVTMRSGNLISRGLHLEDISGAVLVQRNKVTNAGLYGLYMLRVNTTGTSLANGPLIANNMIGGGFQNGVEAAGILLNDVDYARVAFNSVNVDQADLGIALDVYKPYSTGLDIRNNSLAYIGGGDGYAMRIAVASVLTTLDYNNYHSNGDNFVYYDRANRPTLDSLKKTVPKPTNLITGPASHDMNSESGNPGYLSATNLHITTSSPLTNSGITMSGINVDYDGTARNGTRDIGAHEVQTSGRMMAATAASGTLELAAYPNPVPAGAELSVRISSETAGQVRLQLTDMLGRVVMNVARQVEAGTSVQALDLSNVSKGLYILTVEQGSQAQQIKIVKE